MIDVSRPARRCAANAARARVMWSGRCSPTSMPTSTCWSTATLAGRFSHPRHYRKTVSLGKAIALHGDRLLPGLGVGRVSDPGNRDLPRTEPGSELPTAVLSMGLMIPAVLSVSSRLVLDTVTRGRREMKLLAYLSQPAIN